MTRKSKYEQTWLLYEPEVEFLVRVSIIHPYWYSVSEMTHKWHNPAIQNLSIGLF